MSRFSVSQSGTRIDPYVFYSQFDFCEVMFFSGANGLVSDFDKFSQGLRLIDVKPLQVEYYAMLDNLGIRSFFEPLYSYVTLLTEVGVRKPDKKIFRAAVVDLRLYKLYAGPEVTLTDLQHSKDVYERKNENNDLEKAYRKGEYNRWYFLQMLMILFVVRDTELQTEIVTQQ